MFKPQGEKDNDKILVEKLRGGDSRAFDAIYQKYWSLIYTAAYKRSDDENVARDIVQDIFLQLWLRKEEMFISNLSAYLYTAVRNRVFKHMAVSGRFVPIPELLDQLAVADNQADAIILKKEFIVHYESLIAKLTKAQQQIFKLRFHEDLSTIQIAERLAIKRKTVQNQLGKSIAQLRDMLYAVLIFLLLKL
ncbi:RNA polymerase sigma factor [Sphingobacterium sp. SGR-19]|uniref:RNA polymerase sigma factor n=1 Tax=Sphingobacterium sp. SGR-19 TaxID=2710886 RepID=UPI0013EA5871|nr:sigma-70 family RNA polymerase sigma factor [Sphingobacterium sp. SGR-19]NGM66377.1 sigma-70 family RNA polymerase sigma factor [Sphingobacterium sp. SGR-19]